MKDDRDCKHGQLARTCEICDLESTAEYRKELLLRALPHLDDRIRDDNDVDYEDIDLVSIYYDIRDELGVADNESVPRINFTGNNTEDETHG